MHRRAGEAAKRSDETLLQSLLEDVARQVQTDEYHLGVLLLAGRPLRSHVAAHQLVDALENDLAIGSLHKQHAFVAQHLRTVDLDDRAEEILELGSVESAIGAEHERL